MPKARASADSHAAYLVLVTRREGARALLFNAELRYLTEVIDDPLTVDRLCSAGRRCDLPTAMAIDDAMAPSAGATCEILCFSLGAG